MKLLFLSFFLVSTFTGFSQKENSTTELLITSKVFSEILLKGAPDFLAADGDDVWVINSDRVEKLSVKSKKPILSVSIPDACGALIVGFNSLWVASCKERSVYRVDNKTGKILSKILCGVADLKGEISLAVGDNSLWILSDSAGILTRINPETNTIQAKIAVSANSFCAVYNYNSVWITNTVSNSVQRIDPKTNKIVATITVGKTPRFLAAGENGIWIFNQGNGSVSRIDPITNQVVAIIDTKVPGGGGDIATGAGLVWVRAAKGRLLQTINPWTNAVETIYGPVSGSGAVRVTDHFIWVTAHDINTIWILKR